MDDVPEEAVLLRVQAQLDGVETALRRLDEGVYAKCEVCGSAIDDGLLTARPVARRCLEHPDEGIDFDG